MRHKKDGRKLSRTAAHRRALMRNLTTALFEHERIETTLAKAKEARRVAERLITYAKRDDLHSRRLVARVVQNADVAKKLFDTIAPWYTERPGGYTRVLRTRARQGDAGEMAMLELVKTPDQKAAERKVREEAAKAAEKEAKGKKEAKEAKETKESKDAKKEEKETKKVEKKAGKADKADKKAEKKEPKKPKKGTKKEDKE
ncbi:MAG: 50S ribosomal protein L17 [Candidatus Eisenbacteria bacterium]